MGFYHDRIDAFARTRFGGWMFLHVFTPVDKRLMRWTGGRFSTGTGTHFAKNGVLLTCTGAKSGSPRQIPLLTTPWADRFILVASATGAPRNPAWYHNLIAHPECSLLVPGRGELPMVAHLAQGEEREQAWSLANQQYSGYQDYQGRTDRLIPVLILTPR